MCLIGALCLFKTQGRKIKMKKQTKIKINYNLKPLIKSIDFIFGLPAACNSITSMYESIVLTNKLFDIK
jgi:hypothetical protein